MVLQKRRSPVRGRKRVYVLAVCLLLVAVSVFGMGLSRTNARAFTASEFAGEIEAFGVVDYNNAKALHVNIPYTFTFADKIPWNLIRITIQVHSSLHEGELYYKIFSNFNSTVEYIPLSDIGDFSEFATYSFSIDADYEPALVVNPNITSGFALVDFEYEHKDTSIPLPEPPTKEGHTFIGWFFDEECTQAYDGSPVYADTVLYAGFEINRHTVTLNTAGGVVLQPIVLDWGTVPTLPTPTRTGYNFVGWYNGDTEYAGEPVKADTMLTAKWEIKIYTVTFMADGSAYKTVSVPYGSALVDAMSAAGIADYAAVTAEGVRLSKRLSVITEDTAVLVTELSGAEKFGDFVARNTWFAWTALALILGLSGALAIAIAVAHKRG